MSDNWIVQILQNALNMWNGKFQEIIILLTKSPYEFKDGRVWYVILDINNTMQMIGMALLVLFFLFGVVKTCTSFNDIKRPEQALKLFIRFAIAKGLITYGMEFLLAIISISQGIVSKILSSTTLSSTNYTLPTELITMIESLGFFESIPLWFVALIGILIIWVLSLVMIISVYGRFFRLYLFTALAPIPLSSFAGESTESIGKTFLKSYAGVCLEGAVIVLSCIIFSALATSPPPLDTSLQATTLVWYYLGELIFNMLVLVGTVKLSDRVVKDMMGL